MMTTTTHGYTLTGSHAAMPSQESEPCARMLDVAVPCEATATSSQRQDRDEPYPRTELRGSRQGVGRRRHITMVNSSSTIATAAAANLAHLSPQPTRAPVHPPPAPTKRYALYRPGISTSTGVRRARRKLVFPEEDDDDPALATTCR
jgi:hypothetical protein